MTESELARKTGVCSVLGRRPTDGATRAFPARASVALSRVTTDARWSMDIVCAKALLITVFIPGTARLQAASLVACKLHHSFVLRACSCRTCTLQLTRHRHSFMTQHSLYVLY